MRRVLRPLRCATEFAVIVVVGLTLLAAGAFWTQDHLGLAPRVAEERPRPPTPLEQFEDAATTAVQDLSETFALPHVSCPRLPALGEQVGCHLTGATGIDDTNEPVFGQAPLVVRHVDAGHVQILTPVAALTPDAFQPAPAG
jgi:hypothetical protein